MTSALYSESSDLLFKRVTDPDPATPGDPLTRLRYHYGQCLNAEDFETEQRYHVLRRRLHNALLHGVGTVWGLEIRRRDELDGGAVRLICDPGMAIDALGREIWVPQELCLDLSALSAAFWAELQRISTLAVDAAANGEGPKRAYVVLRYVACKSEPVPAIPVPCGEGDEGTIFSRLRDSYRLCLEAKAPPDPYATVRDISRRPRPAEPRQRLLHHALNRPLDPDADPNGRPLAAALGRFWSGADDAALLLATIDLKANRAATDDGTQPVELEGNPDNSVRAVLPAVQSLADLVLGVRLEGQSAEPPLFQALGVNLIPIAANGNVASAENPPTKLRIEVRLSEAISNNQVSLGQSLLILVWNPDTQPAQWLPPNMDNRTITSVSDPPAIQLEIDSMNFDNPATFQVVLIGTGPGALLSKKFQPLAGVAGEVVPAGCGREAHLFATYTPSINI